MDQFLTVSISEILSGINNEGGSMKFRIMILTLITGLPLGLVLLAAPKVRIPGIPENLLSRVVCQAISLDGEYPKDVTRVVLGTNKDDGIRRIYVLAANAVRVVAETDAGTDPEFNNIIAGKIYVFDSDTSAYVNLGSIILSTSLPGAYGILKLTSPAETRIQLFECRKENTD